MSKGDFAATKAAIGRKIASVPEIQTMDVYNAFSALAPAEVPECLMSAFDIRSHHSFPNASAHLIV